MKVLYSGGYTAFASAEKDIPFSNSLLVIFFLPGNCSAVTFKLPSCTAIVISFLSAVIVPGVLSCGSAVNSVS